MGGKARGHRAKAVEIEIVSYVGVILQKHVLYIAEKQKLVLRCSGLDFLI